MNLPVTHPKGLNLSGTETPILRSCQEERKADPASAFRLREAHPEHVCVRRHPSVSDRRRNAARDFAHPLDRRSFHPRHSRPSRLSVNPFPLHPKTSQVRGEQRLIRDRTGKKVLESGWGLRHPLDGAKSLKYLMGGTISYQYVLVYAPRNPEEIETAIEVVKASIGYMTGSRDVRS